MAEAGLFPGVMLYLTYWFGRRERARANGAFLVAVCLTTPTSWARPSAGAPRHGRSPGLARLAVVFVIEACPP